MLITRLVGSSVIITCDIHGNDNYIHWYRFQKGQDPQHFLYYNSISSTTVVDSRLDPEKYHVYTADRRYKFVLRNVEESDSALYYCATWAPTMIQPRPHLYWKISLQLFLVQTNSHLTSSLWPPLLWKGNSGVQALYLSDYNLISLWPAVPWLLRLPLDISTDKTSLNLD